MQQYWRIGSTGSDWVPIDSTNLQTTVTPAADSFWMLSGNIDLWTATAGVNQDVAIFVSGGIYGHRDDGRLEGEWRLCRDVLAQRCLRSHRSAAVWRHDLHHDSRTEGQ